MLRLAAASIVICLVISGFGYAAQENLGAQFAQITQPRFMLAEETTGEVSTGEAGQRAIDSLSSRADTAAASILIVDSDPDSADILIDGKRVEFTTPHTFSLIDTFCLIEIVKAGYEPLAEKIQLFAGEKLLSTFLLKALPPPPITSEELGLELLVEQPLLDERAADRIKTQSNSLSLTFAIVPFGQGVLARTLLSEKDKSLGNTLMISGVVLSAGSYALGRVLSSKKRSDIRRKNEIIKSENEAAKEQNREIDKAVKSAYDEAVAQWLIDNTGRGKVLFDRQ